MSYNSVSDTILFENGGMAPLVPRMKAISASSVSCVLGRRGPSFVSTAVTAVIPVTIPMARLTQGAIERPFDIFAISNWNGRTG